MQQATQRGRFPRSSFRTPHSALRIHNGGTMTATSVPVLGVNEQFKVSVEEVKAAKGAAPWGHRIAVNDHYNITVICQDPGHQNDWHYHLTPEIWYIYEGELSWTLEGQQDTPIHV